jgi:hypothetical protein
VEPSRSGNAQSRLACLTAVLFGFTMLWQPIIVVAADNKGEANTVRVAVPGPGSDNGLREPSTNGSVIMRGTRPAASQLPGPNRGAGNLPPSTAGFPIGPYTGGFEPALTGSGSNSTYDYSGLNPATTPR